MGDLTVLKVGDKVRLIESPEDMYEFGGNMVVTVKSWSVSDYEVYKVAVPLLVLEEYPAYKVKASDFELVAPAQSDKPFAKGWAGKLEEGTLGIELIRQRKIQEITSACEVMEKYNILRYATYNSEGVVKFFLSDTKEVFLTTHIQFDDVTELCRTLVPDNSGRLEEIKNQISELCEEQAELLK